LNNTDTRREEEKRGIWGYIGLRVRLLRFGMTAFCSIRINSETGMIELFNLFWRAAEEAGGS
jgi:hypothetical protein